MTDPKRPHAPETERTHPGHGSPGPVEEWLRDRGKLYGTSDGRKLHDADYVGASSPDTDADTPPAPPKISRPG